MEAAASLTRSVRRFALVALLLAALAGCSRETAPRMPHVVMISADALRWDHLSMNGYPRATSPHIDAFAARATQFADAVTSIPKTGPSFATLFTGLPPRRHGVDANRFAIGGDLPVLAERLAAVGYDTVAFVSNPVLKPIYGFSRGFTRYEVFAEDDAMEQVVANAQRWIDGAAFARPTFLWIHLIDPHGPYLPDAADLALFADDALARGDARRIPLAYEPLPDTNPIYVLGALPTYQRVGDEDRVAHYVAAYDAEIRRLDRAFGALLDALARRGLADGALVLFLSDHGESMGEHDYWFEHGWFAFDGSLRVPLLVRSPGQREAKIVHGPASLLDVTPTVLAAAGLPPAAGLPGRDLLGAGPATEPVLVFNATTYPERYAGLRTPDWKYLRRVRPEDGVGAIAPRAAEELYDLRADPAESRNLAAEQPERVAAQRGELERRLYDAGPPPKRFAPELDGDTREQLRALGYAE